MLPGLEYQFSSDLDGWFQRPVDRAAVCKDTVHSLSGCPEFGRRLQAQHDVNAADDQDLVLCFYFARCIRYQLSRGCINLTRLQRASEGPGQSTRGGRNDVVQRGGMGLKNVRRYFIVFRDCAMYPEEYRVPLRWEPRAPKWTFDALDPHTRNVGWVRHADHDMSWRALRSSHALLGESGVIVWYRE